MEVQRLLKLKTTFSASFWVWIACFPLYALSVKLNIMPLVIVVGLVFIIATWTFFVMLFKLAKYQGKSWVVWCGLTFITSPFGILFAYPIMLGSIKESLTKIE